MTTNPLCAFFSFLSLFFCLPPPCFASFSPTCTYAPRCTAHLRFAGGVGPWVRGSPSTYQLLVLHQSLAAGLISYPHFCIAWQFRPGCGSLVFPFFASKQHAQTDLPFWSGMCGVRVCLCVSLTSLLSLPPPPLGRRPPPPPRRFSACPPALPHSQAWCGVTAGCPMHPTRRHTRPRC